MSEHHERLRLFLNENDHFAKENGMRIVSISEGHAVGELIADNRHRNGLGVVQGGALFTLGDFTFAGAVNSYGKVAIGMSSTASYLAPGMGTKFTAAADVIHYGKKTAVFQVNVFDEKQKLIATFTHTGFVLDKIAPGFED